MALKQTDRLVDVDGKLEARVYRDTEYNEYRVRLFRDGKLDEPADAFEDDREAAMDTAGAMVPDREWTH